MQNKFLVRLLFLFLLFDSKKGFSQTDQLVSTTAQRETEPFIVVNPADSTNLIAAWMRISFPSGIATKTSHDGGITWGNYSTLPHFSPSFTCTSADVSITFNKAGIAFIAYVDYKVTLDSGYVRVATSTNGGDMWNPPVNAIDGLTTPDLPVDRPWIVCDQTTGAYGGRIYLVSKSYFAATPPHKIWLSISTDSANSFSPITQLDNPVTVGTLTNIMAVPTVGADGSFYSVYASWNTSIDPFPRFVCTKSIDGGSTFTQSTVAYPVSGSPVTDTLYQGSYSITANPANATNLIFQATDARNGDPDVLTVYSTNSGANWSAIPVRVNDDFSSVTGIGQDMSWGAFAPNGVYGIAWRDRRNGITNDTSDYEIYASISVDGGITFKPNFCLSSTPTPFINQIRGNDFIGIALTNGFLFSDWSDNRNNATTKEDIYVRKTSFGNFTSVTKITEDKNVYEIFPNPANDLIYISIKEKKSGEILISDISGKILLTKKLGTQSNSVSLSKFAPGSYIYYLKIDGINYSGKLIKE